jgi:hypothetical protein
MGDCLLKTDGRRPVFLRVEHPSGAQDQIFITLKQLQEDRSVFYICCWPSPAQSFWGPSSAVLITIFYCIRIQTFPTSRARSPYLYPPGTGWPSYTPRHWVPFASPPTTRRATVELLESAFTRGLKTDRGLKSKLHYDWPFTAISSFWHQARWDSRTDIFLTDKGALAFTVLILINNV